MFGRMAEVWIKLFQEEFNGLLEFQKIHKTDLIIINLKLYSQADIDKLHSKLYIKEVRTINNYIIYKT